MMTTAPRFHWQLSVKYMAVKNILATPARREKIAGKQAEPVGPAK